MKKELTENYYIKKSLTHKKVIKIQKSIENKTATVCPTFMWRRKYYHQKIFDFQKMRT